MFSNPIAYTAGIFYMIIQSLALDIEENGLSNLRTKINAHILFVTGSMHPLLILNKNQCNKDLYIFL